MYHSVAYDRQKKKIYIWDDANPDTPKVIKYEPYHYVPAASGILKSLDGNFVQRIEGQSSDNYGTYENDVDPITRTLVDEYFESDDVSKVTRHLFFDIEVDISDGYPDTTKADKAITSIALRIGDEKEVYIVDSEGRATTPSDKTIKLVTFDDERGLLKAFVKRFNQIRPTAITGWNIDYFDVPYLCLRISKVLGKNYLEALSPIGIVKQSNKGIWKIEGVAALDYMALYKRFTYTELPNYRLDTVAKEELGKGKIEYEGNLDDLLQTDIDKYIMYNMVDVDLVYELDKKLDFMNLARTICHKGHVPYDAIYATSRVLDGAALTFLKREGIVANNKPINQTEEGYSVFDEEDDEDDKIPGAFVMDPIPGLYLWIYDIDLESLYPSNIRSLNISPETKEVVIQDWNPDEMLSPTQKMYEVVSCKTGEIKNLTGEELVKFIKSSDRTISSAGVVYSTKKPGFIPSILTKWFKERKEYKSARDKYAPGSDEYKYYDSLQLTQKVLLNSFYGVLALRSFRFFDLDNATSVTLTGQSVIKFSAKVVNRYYKNITGEEHFINATGDAVDYSFYTDTDSLFVSALPIIQVRYPDYESFTTEQMVEKTVEVAKEVESHINALYAKYAEAFHNIKGEHHWRIKQEYVAKSGIWVKKKRYAQWIILKEGAPVDKMDIKGLDAVRSSFPTMFVEAQKEVLWDILKERGNNAAIDTMMKFKDKMKEVSVLDIMSNSSVKEYSKWQPNKKIQLNKYKTKCPVHVKAAINYNGLLQSFKDKDTSPVIDKEKVKWGYVKTNEYGVSEMALKGDKDPIQIREFVEKYIDYDKIYEQQLKHKIDALFMAMKWGPVPQSNNINKFFKF